MGDSDLTKAISLAKPNWNFNEIGLPLLEHYVWEVHPWGIEKRCLYAEKSECDTGTATKPIEDPSEFLEEFSRAYRKYADLDPEAPENIRMVNVTFLSQSAPGIRKKLQKLEGGIGLNPSQVVDIAKVYNNREQKEAEVANIFLEQVSGQFHWRAHGTRLHLKRLPLVIAHIAKERGTGKWVPPVREREVRIWELEWYAGERK